LFNTDPKLIARIAPHIERVLIVDSNLSSARLVGELLKAVGSRRPIYAHKTERALDLAAEFRPQLVFTDLEGPELDGVELTHRLRRSGLAARKAPVVITAFQPSEGAIRAARDAGAHEFLVKPFTAGHLFKRVENVTLKPRLWIEARQYVGPDRRRFNAGEFAGPRKRRSDETEPRKLACIFASAEETVRSQLDLYELRPHQALKGMLEQASVLQGAAFHHFDPDLASAVTSLLSYLALSVERGELLRAVVEQHMTAIRAIRDPASTLDAPSRARLLLKLSNAAAADAAAA
jgi:CheY-like chemotaxis protein